MGVSEQMCLCICVYIFNSMDLCTKIVLEGTSQQLHGDHWRSHKHRTYETPFAPSACYHIHRGIRNDGVPIRVNNVLFKKTSGFLLPHNNDPKKYLSKHAAQAHIIALPEISHLMCLTCENKKVSYEPSSMPKFMKQLFESYVDWRNQYQCLYVCKDKQSEYQHFFLKWLN